MKYKEIKKRIKNQVYKELGGQENFGKDCKLMIESKIGKITNRQFNFLNNIAWDIVHGFKIIYTTNDEQDERILNILVKMVKIIKPFVKNNKVF